MRRRKTAVFFLVLGISLSTLAVALNITWILLNLREVVLLVFGAVFFALIITGLILNTIFLLREIRRNEQHDAFLNAVTHELKTPVASIKLYLETLKSRPVPEEKRQEFYDIMLSDSDRLLGTVEQVLQASKTREKQRSLNVAEYDLAQLLAEAIKLTCGRYNLDEAVIRLTAPNDRVMVLGDHSELQTAFSNLLDNAVKYSDETTKISVRLTAGGNGSDIFFRDTGVGIARGDLKRIFKRFYRAPAPDLVKTKGTGLGLPIVRSIIEKHGGRVHAESRGLGKGSTFIVHLPRA